MRFLIALFVSSWALANAHAGPMEMDRKKLKGDWIVESIVVDGEVQALINKARIWTFEKDTITYRNGEFGAFEMIQLDVKTCPRRMSVTSHRPGRAAMDMKVIYKFEGDRLILCVDTENRTFPRTFTSESGSGIRLIVLSRSKSE